MRYFGDDTNILEMIQMYWGLYIGKAVEVEVEIEIKIRG